MSDRRTEIQVGLALVAALFVLVFGLMWFESYQIGADYQRVEVTFPKVGGLGAGDPVDVRGISMGKVSEVRLTKGGVLTVLRLRGDVRLTDTAVFTLGSAGIMGERMIAVEPGEGNALDPSRHVFEGVYEAASTELVGQFEEFNQQVMSFLNRADDVLASLQEDGVLVRTLTSTTAAAETAAKVLTENRQDMKRAFDSLASVSKNLDEFFEKHGDDMGKGAEGLARATDSLDTLTSRLIGVLDDTNHVLTALREQKGAAGKMIYDEQAGQDLVESLKKLRFLVEDLQRNPERYLTVKIF